jgi:hypothetical protein
MIVWIIAVLRGRMRGATKDELVPVPLETQLGNARKGLVWSLAMQQRAAQDHRSDAGPRQNVAFYTEQIERLQFELKLQNREIFYEMVSESLSDLA